jgi:predicted lipoprotein with Yx(FWY)xxD motif
MRLNRLAIGFVPGALALALAACGGTVGSNGSAAASPSSSSSALIHTASIKVGVNTATVLVNTTGLTLYYFTADTATTLACTGGCAGTWPPLLSTSAAPGSDPALPGQLTVLTSANGNQVLYNGHPLYTYSGDRAAGDANGQGILGKWFVATPDLAAGAAVSATPTASASAKYTPVY